MQNDKYAPKSYFFTNPAAISQSAGQAFGPVSTDEYRLTTLFTLASAAPVYAICKGIVLIQPQTGNSDKVNLVLRPFSQPVQGINIKYFIYRGLDKAGFFNGNLVLASSENTSDFINKINSQFSDFYTNQEETVPDFLAKYIGYDPANQADSLSLDGFFFKESVYIESGGEFEEEQDTAYELPLIDAGKTLGSFASGVCGIDIVLNYGDYQQPPADDVFVFNLAYARAADAAIDVSTETDTFKKKLKREQIYQFLDAAAYYGFHASTDKGLVNVKDGGTTQKKTGQQIYTDLLTGFYTRNRLYLYIQGDRTRSYNFYGNYYTDETKTNSLKLGSEESSMTETVYASSGWPLLIDEAPQNHSNPRNQLYLQLVTDNNNNTVLYGQVAEIDNSPANNFMDADTLRIPPDQQGNTGIFTKSIILSNPAVGTSGAKQNIAGFNIMLYQGKAYSYVAGQIINEDDEEEDVFAQPNFFDDIFGELNASVLLQTGENTVYSSITIQRLKLINHYYNAQQQGVTAVQTTRITDQIPTEEGNPALARVTYLTETVDVFTNALSVAGTITPETNLSTSIAGSISGSNTYQLPQPLYYILNIFSDDTDTITGIVLKSFNNTIPVKIILGLTKAENDILKGLINTHALTNARIFLIDLFENGNNLISNENVQYQKYSLGIVGEDVTGIPNLYTPETDILVYSLDRKFHFTKAYSNYMEEYQNQALTLDLNINLPLAE